MAGFDGAFLEASGPVHTFSFSATAITTAADTDLFCLTGSTLSRSVIREVRLSQNSDFGDAQAELIALQFLVGSTAPSSGGANLTPRNVQRHTGHATSPSSCIGPTATVASTTSAILMLADSMNVAAPYVYKPDPADRITIAPGMRFVVRASAPNDAITMSGTLIVQETGKSLNE